MKKELDCLIIRQPYASLIAFGHKRWEFRTYDCKKRGIICIGSAKGQPFITGSKHLNEVARSFPKGVVLATANLTNSFPVTSKELKAALGKEERVEIHQHIIKLAAAPLGEPIKDLQNAIFDEEWKRFVWCLEDVSPLRMPIPLRNNRYARAWVKVELSENEPLSKNLETFF